MDEKEILKHIDIINTHLQPVARHLNFFWSEDICDAVITDLKTDTILQNYAIKTDRASWFLKGAVAMITFGSYKRD
jgi:hypothetical protein